MSSLRILKKGLVMPVSIDLPTFVDSQFDENIDGITIENKKYTALEIKDIVHYIYTSPSLLGDTQKIKPFNVTETMSYEDISNQGWNHFIPILAYQLKKRVQEETIEKDIILTRDKQITLNDKLEQIHNTSDAPDEYQQELDRLQQEAKYTEGSLLKIENDLKPNGPTKILHEQTEDVSSLTKEELEFSQKRDLILEQLNQINHKLNDLTSRADTIIEKLHDLKKSIIISEDIHKEKALKSLDGVDEKELYVNIPSNQIKEEEILHTQEISMEAESFLQHFDEEMYLPENEETIVYGPSGEVLNDLIPTVRSASENNKSKEELQKEIDENIPINTNKKNSIKKVKEREAEEGYGVTPFY
ncbi:MAG: Unknown protein [uncultured Sulfurovum sp.]|uniref:Uncharacterized protein n=1 Tax=uncultured Sulfurovum sp. TaxID=269237 RepID=A0A6S6SDN3_9BACT|nr:MAG: Unknown protein [uncultured Sulfurovum sp.]